MSTEQVEKLLDRLIEVAPFHMQRRVRRLRFNLNNPMEDVIEKLPGKSIVEKAKNLGVARQTMYAWLDGTMRPNTKRAKQIARATGVDVDVIRGDPA